MKRLIKTLCAFLLIFSLSGCKEKEEVKPKKKDLYKYSNENFDYLLRKDLMYQIEYTGKANGVSVKNKVTIMINKDGSCFETGSSENTYGANYINSTSCTYDKSGDNITFYISFKNIYTCYDMSNPVCRTGETTYEPNQVINGTFLEKGKYLQIDDLKYPNFAYTYLWRNYIDYILYDKETDSVYTMDGYPAFNDEEDYRNENQINVDDYNIVDASTYVNETDTNEDEEENTDIGCDDSSPVEGRGSCIPDNYFEENADFITNAS